MPEKGRPPPVGVIRNGRAAPSDAFSQPSSNDADNDPRENAHDVPRCLFGAFSTLQTNHCSTFAATDAVPRIVDHDAYLSHSVATAGAASLALCITAVGCARARQARRAANGKTVD